MWLTPSSTARRRTPSAVSRSGGGPKTPGPGSCIAPKPTRCTGRPASGKASFAAPVMRAVSGKLGAAAAVGELGGDQLPVERRLARRRGRDREGAAQLAPAARVDDRGADLGVDVEVAG